MPQLDVVTFINQYIWLIGSISISIVLVLIIILPNIKKLLEIRVNVSDDNVSFLNNKEYKSLKKLIYYI
nr:ATP synthase F0 subunit 8 [Cassiopea sp. MKL-2023]